MDKQLNHHHDGHIIFANGFAPPLQELWSVSIPVNVQLTGTPLVADGLVIGTEDGGSGSGIIFALDISTGRTVWEQIMGSLPVIVYDHGLVFAVDESGQYQALRAKSGKRVWFGQLPVQGNLDPAITAENGQVFITAFGDMFAVDEFTGVINWTETLQSEGNFPPTVSANSLFVTNPCDALRLSQKSGMIKWEIKESGANTNSSSAYYKKRLYVYDQQCGNAILNGETGSKLGSFIGNSAPSIYADDQGMSYGITLSNGLTEFSLDTGATVWTFQGDSAFQTSPIVVNDYAVVGSGDGTLYVLDAKTGVQLWSATAGWETGAIAAGEGVIVVNALNRLVAFVPQTAAP